MTEKDKQFTLYGWQDLPTRHCPDCGLDKALSEFSAREPNALRTNKSLRKSCKACERHKTQVRKRLEALHPRPSESDYVCPCCGRDAGTIRQLDRWHDRSVWVLHHCHRTEAFIDWLCNDCNIGIGRFNDDPIRIMQAAEYVRKTHLKNLNK